MPDLDGPAHSSLCGKSVGEVVRATSFTLRKAGVPNPALDARIIVAEACDLSPETTISRSDVVDEKADARIGNFIARRLRGEPVSRIIGRREFWGMIFGLSRNVLDPRADTELLVESVLDYVKTRALTKAPLRILDLGTGSGCLLAALLSELPKAHGIAVDISFDALLTARENLRRLGLLDRASFLCANWADAISGSFFDIAVCNPPYIASDKIGLLDADVRAFDPHLALDGGIDGLAAYRAVIPQACRALVAGGYLILEIGYDQSEKVRDILRMFQGEMGLGVPDIFKDLSGADRAVAAVRQSILVDP